MIAFNKEAPRTDNPKSNIDPSALDLVVILCHRLAAEEIDYCHWKSNEALGRSARGENDLDLLVSRADAERFTRILCHLDFKEALVPNEDKLPGVRDYYGYDRRSGRLVHVHAHFQLILGNDLSKNYRLPLEKDYLESSVQGDLLRVPALEWELVVFVIRMVLKHATWDSILMGHGNLSSSERRELNYLFTPATVVKAQSLLCKIPALNASFFEKCIQILQPDCSLWMKISVGGQLQKLLQASARASHPTDVSLKLTRRLWWPIRSRVFGYNPKNRFANGGLFIAIVGGDGAGKTTIINELSSWLSRKFELTKVHMGKPRWSWTTFLLRAFLKIGTILRLYRFEGDVYEEAGQSHGLPWFIRTVFTARDRYLTYVQARQFSSNGGVVLCDRYSLPGYLSMDGPQCAQALRGLPRPCWVHRFLARWERSFYEQIKQPDLLIVLKLDPDIAVQRKIEESAVSVRARSTEVWQADWNRISAYLIDAGQSKEEVISQIKSLIWSYL